MFVYFSLFVCLYLVCLSLSSYSRLRICRRQLSALLCLAAAVPVAGETVNCTCCVYLVISPPPPPEHVCHGLHPFRLFVPRLWFTINRKAIETSNLVDMTLHMSNWGANLRLKGQRSRLLGMKILKSFIRAYLVGWPLVASTIWPYTVLIVNATCFEGDWKYHGEIHIKRWIVSVVLTGSGCTGGRVAGWPVWVSRGRQSHAGSRGGSRRRTSRVLWCEWDSPPVNSSVP